MIRPVPYRAYPLRSACCCIFFKGVLCSLSRFSPIWCAIIWCKPHCTVLNYLGPVAPCRSIRDGKTRLNHAELSRTGWSYCATYYKIAESAEITEIAERPESAERRRKGLFWGDSAKKIGARRGGSTGGWIGSVSIG